MATTYSTYFLFFFFSHVLLCAWCILPPPGPNPGPYPWYGSGSGSGSGFSDEEIIIPSRFQRSYPMHGLFCFPDGLRLPCECDNPECPCCRDWITGDCYRPTFYRWSKWLPCLECNDLCDETQDCRIKYDNVTPDLEFGHKYSPAPNRRKRRDDGHGPMSHPFLEWLQGPGKHRCQVQRTECRPKQEGRWSDWIPVGPCSQDCGQGEMAIVRYCLDEDNNHLPVENCEGGQSTGVQPCNVNLCQAIGEWVGEGSCYIEDGACIQNATRTCDEGTALTDDCSTGTIPCEEECSFGTWGEWTQFGPCSETCRVGNAHFTRTCLGNDNSVLDHAECEGGLEQSSKEGKCNEDRCVEYSPWGGSGECSLSCGGGEKPQSRTCDQSGSDPNYMPPENCTASMEPCNMQPCVELGPWGEWGPCSSTCSPGVETRTRPCYIIGTTTVTTGCNETDLEELQPCGQGLCTAYDDFVVDSASTCRASRESCQVPQANFTRSCTGGGSSPADCTVKKGPCTPNTTANVLDILVIIDAGENIDGPTSTSLCTNEGGISFPDSRLNNEAVLPNFVNLKNFLNDFVCSFHNISTVETRLRVYRHQQQIVGTCQSLPSFAGTDNLLTEINELDLVCSGPDTLFTLYCADQVLSTSRPDAADIVLLIVSELTDTVKGDLDFMLGSTIISFPQGFLNGKVFAVVYAGDNPTNANILLSTACLLNGPAVCSRYLGTTRDDVHSIIDQLLDLPPYVP